MTMFDEMEVGIHLPIGTLNIAPVEISNDRMDMKHQVHHHHHDEENQYGQRITLPLPR